MTDDYMCPFCVTPWKCNGPHIEPEDMAEFEAYSLSQYNLGFRDGLNVNGDALKQEYANGKSHGLLEGWSNGFEEGYIAAIDAAEAAVAELTLTGGWTTPDGVIEEVDKIKAIAAIRALKEKP